MGGSLQKWRRMHLAPLTGPLHPLSKFCHESFGRFSLQDVIFVADFLDVSACTTFFYRGFFGCFSCTTLFLRYFCRRSFGRFSLHDVPCRNVFTRSHIHDYRRRCSAPQRITRSYIHDYRRRYSASRPFIYPGFWVYYQYLHFYQILNLNIPNNGR